MVYAAVADESNIDDLVMKRMDEEFKKRFDGSTLDEFLEKLKRDKELEKLAYQTPNRFKRGNSMTNLNRDLEEDDRRVNTDPMDSKQRKKYDKWVNPFAKEDFFDNCYADSGTLPKRTVNPENIRTKITQNKDKVLTGDEFERDFERRWGFNLYGEGTRGRQFDKLGNHDDEDLNKHSKKKNRLRGRKGKYYEQVDDED